MKFEPGYLFGMALQTIPEPRKIAREVQALRFSHQDLWQAFALFAVLATGINVAASILIPLDPAAFPDDAAFVRQILANPLLTGFIQACFLVVLVFGIYLIGRMFGGHGRFDQALLTVIWLQYVILMVDVGVLALVLVAPGMAALLNLFGFGLSFWILTHFVTEMHGFRSAGLVFVMILISIMAAIIALALILAIIGVGVAGAGGVS
ncbi:MAG TPA: YIP1 family protein [Aliiroseovarius sp.]|nr:YIP1 family protein [Aliiroseovarius sp.]